MSPDLQLRRVRQNEEPPVDAILAVVVLLVHLYVFSITLRHVLLTEPFELRAFFEFRGLLGLSNLAVFLSTNALLGLFIASGLARNAKRDPAGTVVRIAALLLLAAYTGALLFGLWTT